MNGPFDKIYIDIGGVVVDARPVQWSWRRDGRRLVVSYDLSTLWLFG